MLTPDSMRWKGGQQALHRDVFHEVAEEGDGEQELGLGELAGLGGQVALEREDAARHGDEDQRHVVDEGAGDQDDELGDGRQLQVEALEDVGEGGDDLDDEEDEDRHRDDEEHGRVGQGGDDLALELFLAGQVLADLLQGLGQLAAHLAGLHQGDPERVEDLGVALHRLVERGPARHVLGNLADGLAQGLN
jgi:hypothetical protein